jgi:hypothetical protein
LGVKEPVPDACGWVTLTLASTMVQVRSHTVERSKVIDPVGARKSAVGSELRVRRGRR